MGIEWRKYKKRFNKDLEELKSKQTEMNNTINEMKHSLEGINSRITEAEERISDLEDKTVEITSAEQNEEKRKELRTVSGTSGTTLNVPTFKL